MGLTTGGRGVGARDRRKWVATAALGAALSLLLGTGLFAAVSDSAESTGNKARSGTIAGSAHDVTVARVAFDPQTFTADDCAAATYGDGPLTALFNADGNINVSLDTTNYDTQHDVLCVKNSGASPGRIRMIFDNVVETEVGVCESSESAAGDASCADGAAGELKSVLESGLFEPPGSGAPCAPLTTSFASLEGTGQVVAGSVAPGQICIWQLFARTDSTTTENQRLPAQTDLVQWDITFVLEDIPA